MYRATLQLIRYFFCECVLSVCCHPIYSGHQACGRPSRGHTGFLHLPSDMLALFFLARRIQPCSIPSWTVKSNFVYSRINELIVLYYLLGDFLLFFCARKVRVTSPRFELSSLRQKVSRLPTGPPPERPAASAALKLCQGVVCVCFLPIHSGHQWTYQPGSHRISHPPSFCGACLNFSREKDSAIPFPRRP